MAFSVTAPVSAAPPESGSGAEDLPALSDLVAIDARADRKERDRRWWDRFDNDNDGNQRGGRGNRGRVEAQPTPTPTPSPTPQPTATPAPTATPEPTATPAPTATPEPTATPAPTATPEPTATPHPTDADHDAAEPISPTFGDAEPPVEPARSEERVAAIEALASTSASDVVLDEDLTAAEAEPVDQMAGYSGLDHTGSMFNVVDQINARGLWEQGITGAGVHVAVIDTGIAPVAAFEGPRKIVAAVDLSFESHIPEAVFLDTNGHGSHIAGIIAGRSPGADPTAADGTEFLGVAPDAGIVSVKVGDNTGAVDVSQVIAGIEWVIRNRNADGLNIRVINLSYGTDGEQNYDVDPLSYAVERAWDAGIVVVVAAGNEGWTSGGLSNPARDPFVISVGAAQATSSGMTIPSWTSTSPLFEKLEAGEETKSRLDDFAGYWTSDYSVRMPDIVAPGASIESLRVPGSRVATEHPEGYVTDYILRGSGSSQATAVVSGAVALLLQARPELTPDQVKAILRDTATDIPWALEIAQGRGLLDVATALRAPVPADAKQTWERSTGLGSLQAARGTQYVTINGVDLVGEVDVLGQVWTVESGGELAASGASWSGASWSSTSWSGASWSAEVWLGASWSGASWSSTSWSGASWSGASWSGASWSGASWSGASWSGASWSGASWSGASWSGEGWHGAVWT